MWLISKCFRRSTNGQDDLTMISLHQLTLIPNFNDKATVICISSVKTCHCQKYLQQSYYARESSASSTEKFLLPRSMFNKNFPAINVNTCITIAPLPDVTVNGRSTRIQSTSFQVFSPTFRPQMAAFCNSKSFVHLLKN